MADDRRRKYPPGQTPWELEGIPQTTWRYREKKRLEAEARGEAPKPVEAPVPVATVKISPTPERLLVKPAAPATMPQTGNVPVAVVNVTLRSRIDQHDRLRELSFRTRRSIQDLVSTAVDEFLARQ